MNILVTAGPTWIKIDEVRILTSIFTGKTGLYLAKEFAKKGHSVTLLINPHCLEQRIRGMRVIPFSYFEDFKEKIIKELKDKSYGAIIHGAAISDYKLKKVFSAKIPSGKKNLALKLIPTEKIIKTIRSLAKNSILIQFKLEIKRKGLLKEAQKSLQQNKSDFVVANALEDLRHAYKTFLIDRHNKVVILESKKELFLALLNICK
jgi:phosphopantothenoylcysteine decarboxylase/phosphopantothenate--cysteine ligase